MALAKLPQSCFALWLTSVRVNAIHFMIAGFENV
jgi:hypothetical protein